MSSSPNHQTGRHTPLETRAITAMAGSFGYELDPAALSETEREQIRRQIARYWEIQPLLLEGRYYRLPDADMYSAWQFVSGDGARTLVSVVVRSPEANPRPLHIRLRGLDPAANYLLDPEDTFGAREAVEASAAAEAVFSGAALMHAGYTLPPLLGDYPGTQLVFRRK